MEILTPYVFRLGNLNVPNNVVSYQNVEIVFHRYFFKTSVLRKVRKMEFYREFGFRWFADDPF